MFSINQPLILTLRAPSDYLCFPIQETQPTPGKYVERASRLLRHKRDAYATYAMAGTSGTLMLLMLWQAQAGRLCYLCYGRHKRDACATATAQSVVDIVRLGGAPCHVKS
jgi:hypothetical protein